MRLLIVTQAIDLDDPVLGFFHRWLEEFSKHCEKISVVCLKEGRHALPANVSVYSLGKENGASRVKYVWNFYRYIWKLRKEYDAVFVHMNQEYVLLGWKFWWLWGKRIVLWRNHKKGSVLTRMAALVSHTVCYTSPEAYVAKYGNAVQMPIGIDTDFFKPPAAMPDKDSILFLGRLDPVKRPEVFVAALQELADEGTSFHADIYGDPTHPNAPHVAALKEQAAPLVVAGKLTFHPSVRNEETPAIYGVHSVYVNLTPSGSFDKTIGEAMACGCVVVAANAALKDILPGDLFVAEPSKEFGAAALSHALSLSESGRIAITQRCRTNIEREQSLVLLAERLAGILQ